MACIYFNIVLFNIPLKRVIPSKQCDNNRSPGHFFQKFDTSLSVKISEMTNLVPLCLPPRAVWCLCLSPQTGTLAGSGTAKPCSVSYS